ncbi:prepilin peptidase [Dactylosporangium sp. CA-139114]|uniref:prepilin peptidase n=1 Tax=Dactylosporangium sp. CA-139114 TaxID=3239931 RepID=UPI003D96B8D5
MTVLTATALGFAGALAGIPVAAVAYSTSTTGPVRLPARWWAGGPAPTAVVLVTATATGIAAAIIGAAVPPTLTLPAFWLFAVLGTGLAIIDARYRRLPHQLTGALWASSGLCFALAAISGEGMARLLRAAGAGAATATVLLVVALILSGQLGLGDVVLAGAVTLNLGWLSIQGAVVGLLAGLVLQGVAAIAIRLWRTIDALTPMGPALFVGWLLGIVYATR